MILRVYTDGGSIGNPGPSAYGYLIYQGDQKIHTSFKFIGHGTNNIAEYTGVLETFKKIKELINNGEIGRPKQILLYADSLLVINQLKGLYKIKKPHIRELVVGIRRVEDELDCPISYTHVPREQNTEADALVKQALERSA